MTDPDSIQCLSEYAEAPDGDRRCVLELDHGMMPHRLGQRYAELHTNRAGLNWNDSDGAASALRVVAALRQELARRDGEDRQ
jgi:hypothetical protein